MKRYELIFIFMATLLFASAYSVTHAIAGSSSQMNLSQPVSTIASPVSTPTSENITTKDDENRDRPQTWGKETHSNKVTPNYEVVFPQDKVNQITITIDPKNWAAMQANMTELFGERGARQGGPGGGGRPGNDNPGGNGAALPQDSSWISRLWAWVSGWLPQGVALPGSTGFFPGGELPGPPGGGQPPQGGAQPADGGPGFGGSFSSRQPMWVPATIEFEGHTWTHVGVRYKGNSSLMSSWGSDTLKMPLKLDFDEFEDEYPEINNQRFYGFKQLSMTNNLRDRSYMNEVLTYDLLQEAGLVASKTAYYEVTLDYGEGPVNLGLYTVVEVTDDTVIKRFFGDDSGNIYEAEGAAASLSKSTFNQIKNSFQKENNEKEADWSDIEALYTVLHSAERTTDPAAWRAKLEAIFDVNSFLKWLAISAVLQHWDTYGGMSHNFYLYHDPKTDQLTWISWDHNEVLGGMGGPGERKAQPAAASQPTATKQPTATSQPAVTGQLAAAPRGKKGDGGMGGHNVSLDKANVGDNWPLIRYLLDDPTYHELYINYLKETRDGVFNPDKMAQKYQKLAELIEPYVAKEIGGKENFETAVQGLTQRTYDRAQAVTDFLATQ